METCALCAGIDGDECIPICEDIILYVEQMYDIGVATLNVTVCGDLSETIPILGLFFDTLNCQIQGVDF